VFDKKPKSEPPIATKLREQIADMAQPQVAPPPRPLVEFIRQDRMAKQVAMNKLEHEISELWVVERFFERHDLSETLARYFAEKKAVDPKSA
jgi:hypothetical protein